MQRELVTLCLELRERRHHVLQIIDLDVVRVSAEPSMFLSKPGKVRHERVDGVLHVQDPDRHPYLVLLIEDGFPCLLPADSVFVLVLVTLASIDLEQVIDHSLVPELVQNWRHRVHRSVHNKQHSPRSFRRRRKLWIVRHVLIQILLNIHSNLLAQVVAHRFTGATA